MSEPNNIAQVREDLTDALQLAFGEDKVVVGWAMVVETIDTTGNKWLARLDAASSGRGLPAWQRAGYLWDALHGNWNENAGGPADPFDSGVDDDEDE